MIINGVEISIDNPVYLIAEMSANHNGSIENAFKTIEKAKESGADAIKIQTYTPDTLTIKSNRPEFYLSGGLWHGRHLYDLYQEAHTPYDWHHRLFEYAKKCDITLFSTPFDDTAVDLLESLNTPAYKIASFEIIDIPLIKRVANTKKPLLISTGTASLNEITEAIKTARDNGADEILLFHCISSYPAPAQEAQLNNIRFLIEKYGVLVGLSDHTIGSDAGFLSVAMGVSAIEKHFIIDRSVGGPDSDFSATPDELKELRHKIDLAQKMLGTDSFSRSNSEIQSSSLRRSIYSVCNKKKGEFISDNDIKIIRPGLGLHPRYFEYIVGSKLQKDLSFGQPLNLSYFDQKDLLITSPLDDFILEEVKPTTKQEHILYELLLNRKFNISHKNTPSIEEHSDFVKNHPYRAWWLINDHDDTSICIGSIYVSYDNSLGLNIDLDRINFSASFFINKLKKKIKPLEPILSKTFGDFFFNVAPQNHDLIAWLSESGYYKSQISLSPE